MAEFCCIVCPHEVPCEDVMEAVFARPEEITDALPE